MDHTGLIFRGGHERGVDRIAHPGTHGPCDFQVSGGDRVSLLIIGNDNPSQSFPEVCQVPDNGKNPP